MKNNHTITTNKAMRTIARLMNDRLNPEDFDFGFNRALKVALALSTEPIAPDSTGLAPNGQPNGIYTYTVKIFVTDSEPYVNDDNNDFILTRVTFYSKERFYEDDISDFIFNTFKLDKYHFFNKLEVTRGFRWISPSTGEFYHCRYDTETVWA